MIGYDLDRGAGPKDSENAPNLFFTKGNGKGFWRLLCCENIQKLSFVSEWIWVAKWPNLVCVAVEQVFDKSDEASDEAFAKLEEKLKEQAAKSRSPTQS